MTCVSNGREGYTAKHYCVVVIWSELWCRTERTVFCSVGLGLSQG